MPNPTGWPLPPPNSVDGVSSRVGERLDYVPGSSGPTDGAVDTLLAGAGVCRDYAHFVVAMLRTVDVPARLVAVYAPGLSLMDFHAVDTAFLSNYGGAVYLRSTQVRAVVSRGSAR